jgi:hypothetical protein
MWTYNTDYNKWFTNDDSISKSDFDLLKQELRATRYYSRILSGATYLPVNSLTDIYDILGSYQARDWFVSTDTTVGSPYSITSIPPQHATPIDINSYDDYSKYLTEYGLTLKNLFTPYRLIKDASKNFYYVDVATTEQIDLSTITKNYVIDGVTLVEGHRVLIKDQTSNVVLLSTADPNTYFTSKYTVVQDLGATIEYQYNSEENGIYRYSNGNLIRETDLDVYEQCVRYSVSVKLGNVNANKQFHLSRLLNGYYPTTFLGQPIEFKEKHNWILRNRVDYNNLFEINYYDIIKHGAQTYNYQGFTYSIPERTIAVGEFGIILNTQEGKSNIIKNKYKVNLRSISQTSQYYWICGDENTLLRVRKHDFNIDRILLEEIPSTLPQLIITNLTSVSFYNDLVGVVVGELNTILYTKNAGETWERIEVDSFSDYNYNKVLYTTNSSFYVAGDTGVLIEFVDSISGWTAYKRRISQIEDSVDEYLLVENINDMYKTSISTWGVSFSYYTQSIPTNKELLFLVTNNNKVIAYDVNNSFSQIGTDFIYFDFGQDYKDIRNITRRQGTNTFYFTGTDPVTTYDGIFSFDINSFSIIGTGSSYSNTAIGTNATFEYSGYPNQIFDYNSTEMLICGNTSLLGYSTYSTITLNSLDSTFEDKLKSKMLVIDYDIASKLNFFTDAGDYRLPNSITFSNDTLATVNSKIGFSPIQHDQTSTNGGTYSETNWLTYWTDTQKTFEYYTNMPLDESKKVLISTTFSYNSNAIEFTHTSSQVTGSASQMAYLAPSILYATHSRYFDQNATSITSPTSLNAVIFLYDYLMVYKVIPNYPISVGDVLKFESDIVDTELIVNKIVTIGSYKYLYMGTDFNQNIINDLQSTSGSIKIKNLNKYTTKGELKENFNSHPISNAYRLDYVDLYGNVTNATSSVFQLSARFNNLTSYYNLQTSASVVANFVTTDYDMIYTSGFLKFGYSPTYNLMDYLTGLNNVNDVSPKFYATKEYLAMPQYEGLPLGSLTASTVYIDYNGLTYSGGSMSLPTNKILFGTGLKLEWDSIFINTFVDVKVRGSLTFSTDKLLVMNKYYDSLQNAYVIEFHKRVLPISSIFQNILSGCTLDIISRRSLSQISADLQELNNIQRAKMKSNSWQDQDLFKYDNYQNELNFKIPTDSYAKILLSDSDTIQTLSALIYVDYKNELAMNITRLAKEYNVPILNTINQSGTFSSVYYTNKLYISCSEKHDLLDGEGVVLEFNGGVGSSQELNPQYFGYHVITKITEYDFITDIDYGNIPTTGSDTGYVKYTKQDPFLNYQPVDLIDLGVDGRGKMSLELSIENLSLLNSAYSLINVDFEKYRFRLVDGLDMNTVNLQYAWLLEAELSGAVIGSSNGELVWYKGTWLYGRWFGGTWQSGVWMAGDWYGGTWNANTINDKILTVDVDTKTVDFEQSFWYDGRWFGGTWNAGIWYNGRWYDGTWNNGMWYKGIWNDGTWNNGRFEGGIWIIGTWNNGVFNCDNEPTYWLDGKWLGGDFENGMWYNGTWEQRNGLSRFGTKSFNSRTANWQAGKWVSGSFYSYLNTDDNGVLVASEVNKYSIWKTGQWFSGEWYGGIAYDMDFKTGTWYGGILENIQVIQIDTVNNTFTLNGIFYFNTGDNIFIIDNLSNNSNSVFGSNVNPGSYIILYATQDTANQSTTIYVGANLVGTSISTSVDTGLRVVSKFTNLNWKGGIWTNGIYESGLWEGGLWYNGVFNAIWT